MAPPQATGWWAGARARAGSRLSYALADQVVYSFGNLVVAALLRRHRSEAEFGAYILTQRALDILFQLCNVFLWGPFCFQLPGTAAARQTLYRGSIVGQQIVVCVLASAALWGLSVWAGSPAHVRYAQVFAPLVWTSLGILFREFTRRMYFAEMRFREAFWTETATVVLQIAGVEWLLYRGNLTVGSTLTVLSAGAIIVSLWWVVTEWRAFRITFATCVEDLRRNFGLGRWLFGTNMVFMLSVQCNPWVLSALSGMPAAGVYAQCEFPVNIPRVALVSMQNTMAPSMSRRLAEGGRRALNELVTRMDRFLLLGALLFVGIMWFAGPWIVQLIFKSRPEGTHTIIMLLALNLLAMACTMARSYGLTTIHRADLTFYINVAAMAVQGALVVPLVHSFHVAGAALALLLGTTTAAILRAVVYSREIREPRDSQPVHDAAAKLAEAHPA